MNRLFLLLFLITSTLTSFGQPPEPLPNIVFILADDFGYGSLNAYGADKELVRTPALNRLSDAGMRFTNAHTPASVCSPTRYGFLMGEYPWRSRLKFGVLNSTDPLLPDPNESTIADILKEKGYHTAMIGKWHLGYGDKKPVNHTGKLVPGPLQLGFDYHFGVPNNHGGVWGVYIENEQVYQLRSKKAYPYSRSFYGRPYLGIDAPQRENKNVTAELAEKAVDWLRSLDRSRPFFLYFAPIAVHHPITPSDAMRGASGCGPYGDFIQDLDKSVSTILETLNYLGLDDNTIVIFTSDNGGEFNLKNEDAPETAAVKHGLKINGDLRGDKHTIWEGGTRVPFIIRWPQKVAPGSVSDELISLVDVFATVNDVVGGKKLNRESAIDSRTFLPVLFNDQSYEGRAAIVTADARGFRAIHAGKWKYIDNTPPDGLPKKKMAGVENFKPQLYDLSVDPGEKNNVYAQNPETVKEMKRELKRIVGLK